MANNFKSNKIFKTGQSKQASNSIVVGGADLSDLPSKAKLLEHRLEEVEDITNQRTQEIIEEAENQARILIEEAQEKVAEIEQAAYEKGYKDGQLQGIQEANSAIKNILIDCKSVLESIEKERKECLEDEEEKVYFTISNIAKQILKKDLELNPKLSLDFIKAAIDSLEHKLNISIYLEPNTASKINEVKSLILQDFPGLENLNIIGDSKLKAGDLIVESNREKLDLRLESQFEQLMKEICQKNK